MKILYYLPSLFNSGGLERIITLKANYLSEQLKHEVVVLTSEQRSRPIYFPLSKKIKVMDLDVPFDKDYRQLLLIRILKYPFKYYLFKKRFCELLYQYRPDITITTLRREVNFISSVRDGSTKIGEFHFTRAPYFSNFMKGNAFLNRKVNKYWGKHYISNLQKLDRIVLLTHQELDQWPELNNTVVIPNPLAFFPDETSTCGTKKVISVGRYVFDKGFDMLIDAWKKVNERHPDWTLHIYGEGDRKSLNDQINLLQLNDSCFLEKPVINIEKKYLESSIFVLSSRHEGFGMVIAEAMACGVPPISFDCPGGPRDIIKNGIDGILVEHENIPKLADKICFLIENKVVRMEMGQKAKANIERFKIEKVMEKWQELFESLAKKVPDLM